MRVYPQRSHDIGQDMRNECTCGHCRLALVKRESNTARVYKVQLPPIKTIKKAKAPPKKMTAPKLIFGYQNVPKKKPKLKKSVKKSIVRSKPEYDAWYFSHADLHTIAHSNMENYLSRFQPDMQEMGTQTSTRAITLPKPTNTTQAPSKDKAVQIRPSEKEEKNSFNNMHKDKGDSPTRRNSPVVLSALMDNKKASGDFNLKKPPGNLRYSGNYTSKTTFEPPPEKFISMPQPSEVDSESKDHLLHQPDTSSREHKRLSNYEEFILSPFHTKILHSTSKNRIKELVDLEIHRHPQDGALNSAKPEHRQKYDKKHRLHKTDTKIPRKLLETSLKKEKEARKSLKIENDGLRSCITKAEQKVRDMRSSLAELSNTIRTYKTKSSLPYVTRVEKLEKIVDDLIREFRSSSKTKSEVCNSPKISASNQKDIQANYVIISTEPQKKNKNEDGEAKKGFGDRLEVDNTQVSEEEVGKCDFSNLSSVSSSGIVSRSMTVSTASTSLTALKKELGKFFEDMREDTEKLIEEAQFHHQALLSYSERTSSAPSYDSTSTAST